MPIVAGDNYPIHLTDGPRRMVPLSRDDSQKCYGKRLSLGCRSALLSAIQLTDDLIRVRRHHAVTEIS